MVIELPMQDTTPQIVGLMPDGVAGEFAAEIARGIRAKVEAVSSGITVRSLRMVPSSTTHLDGDAIQFIANATVVPIGFNTGHAPVRAKVIDSVVTVDLKGQKSIRSISVPFLEPRS